MHTELTGEVIQSQLHIPGIIRDTILTGFGVRIYTTVKASHVIEPTRPG